MKSKIKRLQEAYYRANKQYQHEIAIGSDRTLITAKKRKRAFVAYNKAIREVA